MCRPLFFGTLLLSFHTINPRAHMENILASQEMQVERKHLMVEMRENERGRFLRITETAHGRRNAVIIPSTGIAEFTTAIASVISHADKSATA